MHTDSAVLENTDYFRSSPDGNQIKEDGKEQKLIHFK